MIKLNNSDKDLYNCLYKEKYKNKDQELIKKLVRYKKYTLLDEPKTIDAIEKAFNELNKFIEGRISRSELYEQGIYIVGSVKMKNTYKSAKNIMYATMIKNTNYYTIIILFNDYIELHIDFSY